MSSIAEQLSPPKLPLGHTIGLAYSTYFEDFIDLLRTSWLWLLVVAGLTIYAHWSLIAYVVELFAGVSIAVAWHRRIILGERPRFSGDNIATGHVWRYLAVAILMALINMAPLFAMTPLFVLLQSFIGTAGRAWSSVVLFGLSVLGLYAAAIAAITRLSLLLPAQAVGNWGLTFREAWWSTEGNTWRLFWGFVACTVPPYIVILIVFAMLGGFPKPYAGLALSFIVGMKAYSVVTHVLYVLIVPISIGFLSHAYRHLLRPAA